MWRNLFNAEHLLKIKFLKTCDTSRKDKKIHFNSHVSIIQVIIRCGWKLILKVLNDRNTIFEKKKSMRDVYCCRLHINIIKYALRYYNIVDKYKFDFFKLPAI